MYYAAIMMDYFTIFRPLRIHFTPSIACMKKKFNNEETGKYFFPSRMLYFPKVILGIDSVLSKLVGCSNALKEFHGIVECLIRALVTVSVFNLNPEEFCTA